MELADVASETGWRIEHRQETRSTNDDAKRLRDAGASARTAVVADAQTAGRGREGRAFLSPPGGLYVSLLLEAPPEARPAGVVAVAALAVCEAIEMLPDAGPDTPRIKWPNDVWIARKKIAGVLVEATADDPVLIVGIGVNVAGVPVDLEPDVRRRTTALRSASRGPPDATDRLRLLRGLLLRVDSLQHALSRPGGLAEIEAAWSSRLALIGERVDFSYAGQALDGVLEAVSLVRGLLVRDPRAGPVWREAALVQDLTARGP